VLDARVDRLRQLGAAACEETAGVNRVIGLHVECAERRRKYDIIFRCSRFCEYMNLECVRVPVIYRARQAEYVFHIRVAASQEYVNTYLRRRVIGGVNRYNSEV